MKTWKVVGNWNLGETERPIFDGEDYGDDGEYFACLFEYENGVATRIVATDGGEPEDQTLTRDWSWVAGALNDAYAAGRAS